MKRVLNGVRVLFEYVAMVFLIVWFVILIGEFLLPYFGDFRQIPVFWFVTVWLGAPILVTYKWGRLDGMRIGRKTAAYERTEIYRDLGAECYKRGTQDVHRPLEDMKLFNNWYDEKVVANAKLCKGEKSLN